MNKILAIARREMAGYFYSPLAYGIGAVFLIACSAVFFHGLSMFNISPIFEPGREASLRPLFEVMAWAMVVVLPLLTMRLISEEFSSGTIETLMTAPVTDAQVVLGKFAGVMGFYLALMLTSIVLVILLAVAGQPDYGLVIMGYLGMILLGATFISVGILASTLTKHQLLAALISILIICVFTVVSQLVAMLGIDPWSSTAVKINVMTYYKDFARGVFDTRGVIFFLTTTVFFLFLAIKSLESRRWR